MPPKQTTILLVDDDPAQIALVAATLERAGRWRTLATTSPKEGIEMARAEAPDLAILDVAMPEMDGIELTRTLRAEFPLMPIVILTGLGDTGTADMAYAAGATDFAVKPLESENLIARVHHVLRDVPVREAAREATLKAKAKVLGAHPKVEELRVFISNVASAPGVSALLLGESGTGKNLAARAIHDAGDSDEARFVEVNCAALPANLLEAELFGYEKGAFTGARRAKQGLVEVAGGGTLFLDEIGSLSPELQAKLLTFLESRRFRRVGGTADRTVELRVVAATNAVLKAEIAAGRFREDLYYRLNVAHFTLPPLREIRSDIPELTGHFVEKAAAYFRKPVPRVEPGGLEHLMAYDWPGNVRELRNVLERALIFSRGDTLRLDEAELPASAPQTAATQENGGLHLPLGLTLEEVERRYIQAALTAADGQVAKAAEELGVTRKVLWTRRKKLGLLE